MIGGKQMSISYDKLWKLLIDKKMSKADLRKKARLAPNTLTRLNRDEEVTLNVLERICMVLDSNIGDIMEFTFGCGNKKELLTDNEGDK